MHGADLQYYIPSSCLINNLLKKRRYTRKNNSCIYLTSVDLVSHRHTHTKISLFADFESHQDFPTHRGCLIVPKEVRSIEGAAGASRHTKISLAAVRFRARCGRRAHVVAMAPSTHVVVDIGGASRWTSVRRSCKQAGQYVVSGSKISRGGGSPGEEDLPGRRISRGEGSPGEKHEQD